MMLDPPHLGLFWQQIFEVAAPTRRVLALSIAARRSPIENAFDPAAHPACGLGLDCPDRLDHLHDEPYVDRLHRQRSEDGIDIGAERRRPLRRVLRISPACLMRGDVALGASSECHRLGRVELRLDTLAPTLLDRIEAVETCLAAFERFLPRLGEAHRICRTEPHLPELAGFLEAEYPAFR